MSAVRMMFAAVILAALSFAGSAPAQAQTAPHGYALECVPVSRALKGHVRFDCTLRAVQPIRATNAFGSWRYGDPMPRAILAQVVGNGGPAICDGINITCSNGVVSLNTGGTLAASSRLCTNGSSQITTTSCPGGDTVTSPNSTLTIGGTSTATTVDINTAHTNTWTVPQYNSTVIGAIGTNSTDACSGTNFPASNYLLCAGANAGSTAGIILGPVSAGFSCTASCTASDSRRIQFWDSLTSGALDACDLYYQRAASGLYASCPLTVVGPIAGNSTSASATYYLPVYTQSGGAPSKTLHAQLFSCTFAAGTTCAVSLTGTGMPFTSATSYGCFADMGSSTTNVQFTIGNKTTTGFTIYAGTSNSDTVAGVCIGP